MNQTRRLSRLRDLLSLLFHALKQRIDFTTLAGLVQSLPVTGVVPRAEFVSHAGSHARLHRADVFAAANGLTPVLRRCDKSHAVQRSTRGKRYLKRVVFQSAFIALAHPESRAFCDRKRAGGKRPNHAVIALA